LPKVIDMCDHVLPMEGLLLRVRELLQFAIQVLEFRGEFLTAQVEFTKRDGFCLVGIEEPLTLPFEALAAL
jgi:hypothetical protein